MKERVKVPITATADNNLGGGGGGFRGLINLCESPTLALIKNAVNENFCLIFTKFNGEIRL